MQLYKYIYFFVIVVLLISCEKKNKLDIDVSAIDIDVTVERFEKEFYNSAAENLPDLKQKYPLLFPLSTSDSVWVAKMTDKDELELYSETQKLYDDFSDVQEQLTDLFKHIKYYYPNFKAPTINTLITNVDYENGVVYADSLLLISLDVYLGDTSKIYNDFPKYIKDNFKKDRIVVDVAEAIAEVQIPPSNDRTFISKIIQEGKKKYLLDAYLPTISDALKMGYTQEQIDWADVNDEEVWKYFVQGELLFSTDQELNRRFLDKAPFSKFYLENDSETPGSIGVWFGWQIVRAFMEKNAISLQEMLGTDNEDIFKRSKYKPTK
ncbi:MAG: gliding motility lipoprotein GldB [Flavobacteriaceae bacterium]|nr:gliding motility lipoprotein GldB [Flavobacteriaceae bacterium]